MIGLRFAAVSLALVGSLSVAGCGQSSPPHESLGKQEQALSTGLVISAFWGGGTGSAYKNDWIEIFNRGTTPVVLTGKTLQYSRSDYRTWDLAVNKIDLTGTIPAGGYYLVVLSANTGGVADLPTADATGGVVVGGTGGLWALVEGTTPLDCGPPPPVDGGAAPDAMATPCTSASIIDFVGYGKTGTFTATVYEGTSAAPQGVATSTIRRKGAGCVETDDNGADFESVAIAGGPAPRNSATAVNLCVLGDGGTDGALPDVVVPVDTGAATDTGGTTADATPDATPDGATGDTGAVDPDTGTVDPDTGTVDPDTGTTPVADTGTAEADTGAPVTTDEVVDDDGCGCRVAGGGNAQLGAGLVGLFFALGAVARRRRS